MITPVVLRVPTRKRALLRGTAPERTRPALGPKLLGVVDLLLAFNVVSAIPLSKTSLLSNPIKAHTRPYKVRKNLRLVQLL